MCREIFVSGSYAPVERLGSRNGWKAADMPNSTKSSFLGGIAFAAAASLPAWAQVPPAPKYSAKVPAYITTPDTVQTRIGTLKFFDGLPDPATVQKVYDNLDFTRGVETFLTGIPAASIYAACEGFRQVGLKPNVDIGMTKDLLDARSLFLTAQTTTPYVFMCLDLKDGPVVAEVPPGVLGPVDDAFFSLGDRCRPNRPRPR